MKSYKVKWEWTIPNVLSILRMALLPFFVVLFIHSAHRPELLWWAGGVLILSGITDLCDGWIARHFNQISDVGKLLDPAADKLTQLTVLVCLATRYRELMWVLCVILAKEAAQALGGWLLLRRGDAVRGSLWFGKVATTVFYASVAAFVLFPGMPEWLRILLAVLVTVLMVGAFLGYLFTYLKARRALSRADSTHTTEP